MYDIFVLLLALIAIITYSSIHKGAPYVPIKKEGLNTILKYAQIAEQTRAADIGSGDGRVVISLARSGADAHGFETNPFLVFISKVRIKIGGHNNAHIHFQDLWKADLSQFKIITVFGLPKIMDKLRLKLENELSEDATVFSYVFRFPGWSEEKHENGVYVYKIKSVKML